MVTLTLRPDLCLIKLAPTVTRSAAGVILAPAMPTAVCYGKVVQTGSGVEDVAVGDVVAFSSRVGDPIEEGFATPHILVPEHHIDFVVEQESPS